MDSKRIKLPKRIAGVKIPKVVRKGPVADFLNSSDGQAQLAELLMLAGGAVAGGETDDDDEANARLSHAFGEAVRAFRSALTGDAPPAEIDDPGVATEEAVPANARGKNEALQAEPVI